MNDNDKNDSDFEITANPGYALGQLATALAASQKNPDLEARTRAARKAEK